MATLTTIDQLGAALGDTFGDRVVIAIIADGAYIFGPANDQSSLEAAGALLSLQSADLNIIEPRDVLHNEHPLSFTGADAGTGQSNVIFGASNFTAQAVDTGSGDTVLFNLLPDTLSLLFLGTADLSINGNAGNAGDVLQSAGPDLAPSWQAPTGGGNVHGSEYFFASDDAVSTVLGNTNFQPKVSLNFTCLGGAYEILHSYGWNHDNTSSDFEGRLLLDGEPLGEIHKQEPKDPAGSFGATGTSQRHYLERRRLVSLAAGAHTLVIEYRTDVSADESSIWEALITVLRVA